MADITAEELAAEKYKLDFPYYDNIPEDQKWKIAHAAVEDRKKKESMASMADILKNTQPLPQQFAGMQNVERDPVKRQQILDNWGQAMIAKQERRHDPNAKPEDYTFRNADLEPLIRAGYQSQNTQATSPADQFIQAVGAGVDPNVAKAAIAMNQPEEVKTGLREIPIEGEKHSVIMDDKGNIVKDFGSLKEKTDNEKNFHSNVMAYNKEIAGLQAKGMLNEDTINEVVNRYKGLISFKQNKDKQPIAQVKQLDPQLARDFLTKAKGDKAKARELAKKEGYVF